MMAEGSLSVMSISAGISFGIVTSSTVACSGICPVAFVTCSVDFSTVCITSRAKFFVVRATASILLIISSKAANGRNSKYLVLPISFVLFLFIILIRFLSGKTLKLL